MKGTLYAIITLLAGLLFTQQIKSQDFVEFRSDSTPPYYKELKNLEPNASSYLSRWNDLKRKADGKRGDKTVDYYYLYRTLTNFFYVRNNIDSLKKYTPIFKELCLKLNDEYYFYRSWDLLCESMLFSNNLKEEVAEHQRMYEDALKRKSNIGMAYSTSRIGMGYATRSEYAKAEPYLRQSLELFGKIKRWNEYITMSSNYIIILRNLKKEEEALHTFQRLDSLADSFLASDDITPHAARILMIKDMASEIYQQPKDTVILKKYLKEIEEVHRKVPNLTPIYRYHFKEEYAKLRNNLDEIIAYQDSSAQHYLKKKNMINLSRTYKDMAKNLYKKQKFEKAYLLLNKYISLNDSIHREEFQEQLSELSARYNINKLELEAQKASMRARNIQYYYACALIGILLITLIVGIKFYLHKLRSNRLLQQQADELLQANERAQQAQLMKTAFIQNMNHEVRTPLNAIVGFSECLTQMQLSPEDTQEICSTIKENSDKLLKIIGDMITIANIDSGDNPLNYQPLSLDKCCRKIIDEMQDGIKSDIKLYYTPQSDDLSVVTDESIVHQVLTNLLHNAIKFTGQGEIELSYRIDEKRKKLFLLVRDTGPGIDESLKEKIFERFYKVDSFVPGSGLGLSLCRVLAERLSGEVYLDCSYKQGSLFVFVQPLRTE